MRDRLAASSSTALTTRSTTTEAASPTTATGTTTTSPSSGPRPTQTRRPGRPPGYTQTPEQRRASANDQGRMPVQPRSESNAQGGSMSGYSRRKKKWNMTSSNYSDELCKHYATVWNGPCRQMRWTAGPAHELPASFSVLVFSPTAELSAQSDDVVSPGARFWLPARRERRSRGLRGRS
jgi:hypothetical protein